MISNNMECVRQYRFELHFRHLMQIKPQARLRTRSYSWEVLQ
jgi:hypothetical protein